MRDLQGSSPSSTFSSIPQQSEIKELLPEPVAPIQAMNISVSLVA